MAIRPCIAATEASISTPVQSPAAYTPRAVVRDTRSTPTKPPSLRRDAGLLEAEPRGVRDRAEREQAVRALDGPAVGQRDRDRVAGPGHRLHPRLRQHGHAPAGEHALQHLRGVGVLAGQHPVARGHQRDVDAERVVGRRELGSGDAGADHDELRRHLVEVVDLLPGEDPLAVGLRGLERARGGAGGDQDGVRLERLLGPAVDRGDHDLLRPLEARRDRAPPARPRGSAAARCRRTGPGPGASPGR